MSETTSPIPRNPVRIGRVVPRAEVATLATDPNAWTWGGRINPRDSVLVARGGHRAVRLYQDLDRDPRVAAVLAKRRAALSGREWSLKPADDSPAAEAAATRVEEALKPLSMTRLVEDLLDALLVGFAPAEIMWEVRPGLVVPGELRPRDPLRFRFRDVGVGTELRLLTKGNLVDGEPVPARKFVVHRHGGKYGDPYGLGLGHRLFWPVFFKRQGIGFWLNGLEKFGQPTALGKYPNGTPDAEQEKLMAALSAISADTGVAIPEGMVVELLEAKRTGSFDSYETLVRYFDEEIGVAVLGETLTTSAGDKGSQSLGKVHNEVRLELTKADGDALSETLNASLVAWVAEFNGVAEELRPKIWWEVEEAEDLNARAERDTKIKGLGFRPKAEYIADTYGEGWEAAPEPPPLPPGVAVPPPRAPSPSTVPAPMPAGLAAAFAEALGGLAFREASLPAAEGISAEGGQDPAERLAELLDRRAGAAQERMVAPIAALVARAATLQEVADGLAGLYPQLDTDRLGEAMGQALVLASLVGRDDLASGAR